MRSPLTFYILSYTALDVKLISFLNVANLNFSFYFPFFEILKNKNRKSKIRQVLFLFHLLIAFDDTSIPTEYNIPELQIMFDEILTKSSLSARELPYRGNYI